MIELKSLACGFDGNSILEDVNQSIENHTSVLGANGSGKSTLAKIICGLTPYDGEVLVDGVNSKELSLKQKAKSLSYIPAKLNVYDEFVDVEEFVLQGRFPHKESYSDYSQTDRKIVTNTLEFLNISHLSPHAINSLSSGEQQLVLIAQALAQQSKIIIFDEPTANLDPHNSKIIAQHIKGLKEYHQVILITHDLHLACYIDSPILFIKDKKIASYGREFFEDETLRELYGVEFSSLAVRYE